MSRATIVTDLGFGDAGKGSIVDYLARTDGATLVVRHNGGAQAAHNVVTPDGRHHTFSQFGAGSFVPGVATHLSRFVLVNPLGLVNEAAALATLGVANLETRLTIDERAIIISPYHQAANRLRELSRGHGRHGSCGQGIGEAMADSIDYPDTTLRAADLREPDLALKQLEAIRHLKLDQLEASMAKLAGDPVADREIQTLTDTDLSAAVVEFYRSFAARFQIVPAGHLAKLLAGTEHVVFEGAQGVLLDEWYGFHPYTTWSTTTHANALALLDEAGFIGEITRLGLVRAYATRHGAGPFVTEDADLTATRPDHHNGTGRWQEGFRVGHFDAVAIRYALAVTGGVDSLVITNLDRLYGDPAPQIATSYQLDGTVRPAAFGTSPQITHLARCDQPDLDYQQAITDALAHVQPVYETVGTGRFGPAAVPAYIRRLGQLLEVPISLISTGPTAADKTAV